LVIGIANAIGPASYNRRWVALPSRGLRQRRHPTRLLYTTIASVNDWVVTTVTQQALNGPNVNEHRASRLYPGLVSAT